MDCETFQTSAAEFPDASIREVVLRPYRIVYRIVSSDVIHIITIHHSARGPIPSL
jgi:hypothetical protein